MEVHRERARQAANVPWHMPVNWDWKNYNKGVWNPDDERLFPPKRVGIGWTINFHALLKTIGMIK
jgi:hypothetical protein